MSTLTEAQSTRAEVTMMHESDATFCNSQQSWYWICSCGSERTRTRGLWTELISPELKRLDRREASFLIRTFSA